MSDIQGLRGQQKTEYNKLAYAAYVDRLRATGRRFPCNQFGEANIEGVAKTIGCTPKVLKEGALKEPFRQDVVDIGVDGMAPSAESKLAKKAEEKTKEASSLLKRLTIKIKENEGLSAEVERLSTRVRQLEARSVEDNLSIDELLKTGRRFTL